MGIFGELIRRLRGQQPDAELPAAVPGLQQIQDAVDAAAGERAKATEGLASLLLAVSRSRDEDLIAQTMGALTAADPRTWLALDVSTRRSLWYTPEWAKDAARRLANSPGPLDLLLAACHPNGFVRESAVASLDERTALPVLALRAADWVPQVRDRARQVCREYLDHSPSDAITFLAPVAFALRARQMGGWLADTVENLLRDGPPEAMTAALATKHSRIRRSAYSIALQSGRLDAEQMLRAATTDPDLPIRIMCAQAAIRAGGDPRRLLHSATAAIRAEAVQFLGEAGPALAALPDRSALVRATAQAIVRRSGTDPATRYRALLADTPPSPSVIAGLGETGTQSDVSLLLPWLAHPTSRGRAETVRALRRRGYTSPEVLLPLLADPVSSVTRQVTLSLLDQAGSLDVQSLQPLLDQSQPRHVRAAACRLLRAHDTWTRISVDLQLLQDPDPAVRADARDDIRNWLHRDAATTYSFPTGAVAEELSTLLTRAEPILGSADYLRFHLGLTR